jgi:hypothetical protein
MRRWLKGAWPPSTLRVSSSRNPRALRQSESVHVGLPGRALVLLSILWTVACSQSSRRSPCGSTARSTVSDTSSQTSRADRGCLARWSGAPARRRRSRRRTAGRPRNPPRATRRRAARAQTPRRRSPPRASGVRWSSTPHRSQSLWAPNQIAGRLGPRVPAARQRRRPTNRSRPTDVCTTSRSAGCSSRARRAS